MGEVVDFANYMLRLRGKKKVLEHATKIKAKRDPELEMALRVEVAKLTDWFNTTYPHTQFKASVAFSRHIEELDVRKNIKYFRETPEYPRPLFKIKDVISVDLWFNRFKLDMFIGKYFEERKKTIEGFMNEFGKQPV